VENVITLAFYKGRSSQRWQRIQDAAIRRMTGGQYSHVELIEGRAVLGEVALCLSSSGRDGGVREKEILLKPDSWDLMLLDVDPSGPAEFIRARIGARYDYTGIVLSQVFALGGHSKVNWFCSEIIGRALGLLSSQRISPQMLFDVVAWHNAARF
jgi:hypothetical protein